LFLIGVPGGHDQLYPRSWTKERTEIGRKASGSTW
jgi:hypothetical protein